jgi:signal transduction histidine kinase
MFGPTQLDRLLGLTGAEDPDQARIARLVAITAASGFLAALLGCAVVVFEPNPDPPTNLALGSIATVCGGALWMARRRLQRAAGRLLFLAGAIGTTALLLTGHMVGFRDIAIMFLPVLVIASSLLLDRRDSAFGLGFILALLGAILAATLSGNIRSSVPTPEVIADFGFAVLIVAVSGVASRLMAAGVERSASERRVNRAALSRANEKLEEQAAQRETLIRELEARNTELQNFTYTVSHDLKSPLVTIAAFAGCLERSALAGDREQLLADLKWIKQAQERMAALLTDLLELSRVGRLAHPAEPVSFREIVEEARALTEGLLTSLNVQLAVSDRLPTVTGDRKRLVQVVQNLLENAAKFSRDSTSPVVEIGSRRLDGETVFYVRDDGIGVEPTDHKRIFGLFHKLHPETQGTGIGLALVQRIIEAHGGRVWVESEGNGTGAEFCFTLASPGQPSDTAQPQES